MAIIHKIEVKDHSDLQDRRIETLFSLVYELTMVLTQSEPEKIAQGVVTNSKLRDFQLIRQGAK